MSQNEGHGHVYPRDDGVLARCGGPGICAKCSADQARKDSAAGSVILPKMGDPDRKAIGTRTNMSASRGEDWQVPDDSPPVMLRRHHWATLRRVGWLDQKGRVWTEMPSMHGFDGGSLTPLLIDVREG